MTFITFGAFRMSEHTQVPSEIQDNTLPPSDIPPFASFIHLFHPVTGTGGTTRM